MGSRFTIPALAVARHSDGDPGGARRRYAAAASAAGAVLQQLVSARLT